MRRFMYLTSAEYTERNGEPARVLLHASSWQEAERMAAGLRDANGNPVRVGGHDLDAPSWNAEEPEPPPMPKVRHLKSV